MEGQDKNIPAFPASLESENHFQEGMTLRDYFAAKAMQALVTADDWNSIIDAYQKEENSDLMANTSYKIADAMLKARNK